MKAKIIRIGNSRGVRIPQVLLEESTLEEDVILEAMRNSIVIRKAHSARESWSDAFKCMARNGDDRLLDGDQPNANSWDREEWEWK